MNNITGEYQALPEEMPQVGLFEIFLLKALLNT